MINTKYFIMIGIIICLLIIYFFYSSISDIKKSFVPIYQKTMELESKISQIESESKRKNSKKSIKKPYIKQDSPAFSISYQSDIINKNNLSAKYTEISDTAANDINLFINKSDSDKNNSISKNNSLSKNNKISISKSTSDDCDLFKKKINKDDNFEISDSINILVKNISDNQSKIKNKNNYFDDIDFDAIKSITNTITNKSPSKI